MSLPWAEWLVRQRWYAGRNRVVREIDGDFTSIDPDLDHVVLHVRYDDGAGGGGGDEHYQVLVAWDRDIPEEYVGVAMIGDVDGRVAWDALYDEASCQRLLTLVDQDATRGGLRFIGEPHRALDLRAPSWVSDAEQSNTSVILDNAAILKLFRRVAPGVNPDVELGRVLARADSPHVARLLGAIEDVDPSGEPRSLAMITEFARNSVEGWAMALTSARDLLTVIDSQDRPEPRAREQGGDFAAEACRLGEAVASVHATLAATLGVREEPPPVERLLGHAESACAEVGDLAEAALEIRERLGRLDRPTRLQRVHGDLHLGQVLRTPETWLLIDFEGEPGAPMATRRAFDSPLRDVAGMLRSFDYAAHHLLVDYAGADGADDEALTQRARDWAARNQDAFCDGYAAAGGDDPRDHADLLRAYELDKALYEVVYETRHRPHWAWIPRRALARLLAPAPDPA